MMTAFKRGGSLALGSSDRARSTKYPVPGTGTSYNMPPLAFTKISGKVTPIPAEDSSLIQPNCCLFLTFF